MKTLLLLLLPLFGMGQQPGGGFKWNGHDTTGYTIGSPNVIWQSYGDTIPALLWVQYTRRDLPMLRDCYLINGVPWYRSTAPLTRGKWIKIRAYRWAVSKENWISNAHK